MSPLANSYVNDNLTAEQFFPLHVYVCHVCFLVQLPEHEKPSDIFEEYAYFSSYSESWLNHAKKYVDMIINRQDLSKDSFVIEIASNDGYLLQNFVKKGINALGIEPAKNVAKAAEKKGITTLSKFFSVELAKKLSDQEKKADLLIANNVLAHVPDINDFVKGISIILKNTGIATFEFPSLLSLIKFNQFDTIYHEHYSYLSLSVVIKIFKEHGLHVFDTEELETHGGSFRVYACTGYTKDTSESVRNILSKEAIFGLNSIDRYLDCTQQVYKIKSGLLKTLISIKEEGKSIVGYGAAAKGNTLLNYCGIRNDFLDYVVDKNPEKQGKLLPGTHVRIEKPERIAMTKPEYILILPWNLKDEIIEQLNYVKKWDCKFIVPIPETEVITP